MIDTRFSPLHLPATPPEPEIVRLDERPLAQTVFSGEWPDRQIEQVHAPELHSFRLARPRAQALVYAGGGYTKLMYDKEGVEVALWLNAMGMDAHVVVHRLPGGDSGTGGVYCKDIALTDALSAMKHLERNSAALPLFHVGLSSGGHMAGTMACQPSNLNVRGSLITYAPINANHRDHKYPEDKPDYPPLQKQDFYDDWPIGIESAPHGLPRCPVFLAYALQDRSVPVQHALNLIHAASRNNIDVDAHIYGKAPHGFALRNLDGSHALWPDLAKDWFNRKLAE
ncbi:prolyl oligopeptidase family serine peptidase [uncultured Cohaesibacter sp.]|uniref:alpha/beta hydrolase family protein n=1 Tax=uncultured Cohaesibacter sp. TaxID=1002546 RepID=UPI002931C03E|nr:prolyl oligopeptidase family serine peptidase [uncultured Cohaesibacter sp.]